VAIIARPRPTLPGVKRMKTPPQSMIPPAVAPTPSLPRVRPLETPHGRTRKNQIRKAALERIRVPGGRERKGGY